MTAHLRLSRRRFTCALGAAALVVPASGAVAFASEAYRLYALDLLQRVSADIRIRQDLEAHLDALASAARIGEGRDALTADPLLRDAARAQALEMLTGGYVGHTSESGYRFRQRFEAFGGYERGSFAENAARDSRDGAVDEAKASRLFRQWLDSTGHRRNLMRLDYRFVSTGAMQRGHHLYAVQIYWER